MKPRQKVCWQAAKVIERYGFRKGPGGNNRIGNCVITALFSTDGNLSARTSAAAKIERILQIHHVWVWNDAKERTAEDVIDLLVAAAYGEF